MNQGLAWSLAVGMPMVLGAALMQDPDAKPPGVVDAARAFLQSLPAELQAQAKAPLDDERRTKWNFVPQQYPGVSFAQMDDAQRRAARRLLRAVLSADGARKVEAIVDLEDVLREIESTGGRDASHRDPRRYWFLVFGEPAATSTWAFQVQGHHVSLHCTIERGALLAATPTFLGANPHEVKLGAHRGERVLGRAEDLARGFLALLDEAQFATALVAEKAPPDILLGPARTADGLGAPTGLPWTALTPLQQQMLWRLVEEFVDVHEGVFAAATKARIDTAGRDAIRFAWAGSRARTEGHYFRVQGPTFVLEWDNTQNDANHVHTVFRDLERDFGGDALREHLRRDHGVERGR